MTDVLFIIHDLYQDDVEFPIGIGYLAAVLQKKGYTVKIACQDLFHWTNKELANKWLKNKTYSIIGIGFLSARFIETVLPLCKTVNKYKKDALLVLGGQGATATPEYILKTTKADIAILGEGEETIIELMKNLNNYKHIKGIAYRVGKKVYVNERRQPIKDLDSIPFPAWELFPMDKYTNTMLYMGQGKNEKSFPIISTRGCTNKCSFCVDGETKIKIRNEEKKIKDIKKGDIIKGFDIGEMKKVDNRVEKTYVRKGTIYEIITEEGNKLEISGEHPVYTKRGWIKVSDLTENDELLKYWVE